MKKPTNLIYPTISFLFLLTIWQSVVSFGLVSSIFLPAPSEVFFALIKNYLYLFTSLLFTLKHIALGYLVGVLLAIILGGLIGSWRKIELSIKPLVLIISTVPIVTFLPLFILWFGLNEKPVILCAIIAAFFPTLLNTISGIKEVDYRYIEVAKNFTNNKRKIFEKVIIPATLPHIANGLRSSIIVTFLVTPPAEMIIGSDGLGQLIEKGAELLKSDLIILGQITLGLIGITLLKIFDIIEKKYILPWLPWAKNKEHVNS